MFDVEQALRCVVDSEGSDLHLKVPSRPLFRRHGRLEPVPGSEPLTPLDMERVFAHMLADEQKLNEFRTDHEVDFSYQVADVARFRVNAFRQRGSISMVCRAIPYGVKTVDELMLPPVITDLADEERGVILLTGTTGSGKSTTLAAMIDRINTTQAKHIVTIEDPVEFLHKDKLSIINQREVGEDTHSFSRALRRVLRQDPDVILIGEVRDEETAMTALRAAETGHLVLCTMHTIDAAESVQRFVDLFGERRGDLGRQMMAATLVGICSQRLLPAVNGGMALSSEVLVSSTRVRDLIAQAAEHSELHTAIVEGDYYGMHSFDQSLLELVREGKVAEADALDFSSSGHDFRLMLEQAGLGGDAAVQSTHNGTAV